ncbi:MAG: helix-turn-helix transcriptional regulator [Pseudomonadota bacterium]
MSHPFEIITINGRQYRLVLVTDAVPNGSVGDRLKGLRVSAGLTQEALAKRIGKSQTLIAQAENGVIRVGERHVAAVEKACGKLPSVKNESRLSAAAPELLAACIELIRGDGTADSHQRAIDLASAAIAKATTRMIAP